MKRMKINEKEAGNGPFKKTIGDVQRARERERENVMYLGR